MSIYKMNAEQLASFIADTDAKMIDSFPAPKTVRVLATNEGTVVVLDQDQDAVAVIGDSVGVYWGPDAPDYLS